MGVKLVATVKLVVDEAEKMRLLATMARVNEACDWLAVKAFELKSADKYKLQKLYYADLRLRFGLKAQHAVRAISKVCEAYKRDKKKLCTFAPYGAVPYDTQIYSFKHGMDRVSILAIDGRMTVPCVIGHYHRARLEGVRGQADLVYRKGKLYLYVTVEVPDGSPIDPEGWLGVDLGIRNLAVDNEGEKHSGDDVEAVRQRYNGLRSRLQAVGTKSAKRHLKKLAGREARFRSIENHRISNHLVAKAKDTARGIALEDLSGITKRVTVRGLKQRARMMGWSFFQLRTYITYKAKLAGVAVVLVDPRDTSRTCPACRHVAKENRKTQAEFRCVSCGFEDNADVVGATNIAFRAAVNQPIVSDDRPGNPKETSRSCQAQSFAS